MHWNFALYVFQGKLNFTRSEPGCGGRAGRHLDLRLENIGSLLADQLDVPERHILDLRLFIRSFKFSFLPIWANISPFRRKNPQNRSADPCFVPSGHHQLPRANPGKHWLHANRLANGFPTMIELSASLINRRPATVNE